MSNNRNLSQAEKNSIIAAYSTKEVSQTDLAIQYGIGRTSVRRVLASAGLATYKDYATPKERKLLEVIKTFEINEPEKLSKILQRGLQC